MSVLVSLLMTLRSWARSRAALQLELLALRHQLSVLQRSRPRRLQLTKADRWLWVVLSRVLKGWRTALIIVKPETVIAWHRRGFRLWWTWKSRRRIGRPTVPADIRALIRTMAQANPRWGAPRIHGELLKLGIEICQTNRREISGSTTPGAVADLAHLPPESRRPDRRRRFLRRPDRDLPPLTRPGAPRPRSATHPARGGHRASDGRVDGPTTARGLSAGRGASIPAPRSRSRVRQPAGHDEGDGNRGSTHGSPRALAKSVHRTIYWLCSSRVFRSRHRVR